MSSSTATATSTKTKNGEHEIPNDRELIEEGSVRMLYPKGRTVFYNPVQVQNRDLSILMIRLYARRAIKRFRETTMAKIRRRRTAELEEKGSPSTAEADKAALEKELETLESTTNWTELSGGLRILDALAASGLRSLRYWKEIDGVRSVTINDLDPAAVHLARENIRFNGLDGDVAPPPSDTADTAAGKYEDALLQRLHLQSTLLPPPGLSLSTADATHLLYNSRRPLTLSTPKQSTLPPLSFQYDVIDLDPYGSASPFLDSAIQAVRSGGLLAITCTDMAALGGSHADTCYGRYGGMPIRSAGYLQELAVRILVGDVARRAAVYGRGVRPVVCVGMAFYVRVFLEVWDDKAGVNKLSLSMGNVYQSAQCPSFHIVPHGRHPPNGNKNVIQNPRIVHDRCEETGGEFKTAGPIWIGPLHDLDVVKEGIAELEPELDDGSTNGTTNKPSQPKTPILATHRNLYGLLTLLSEELPSSPLYYTLPSLSHILGCTQPPMDTVRCAMANAGYMLSVYHKEPSAIKTDAPNRFVWDIMREWCKLHPPKKGKGSGKKKKMTKRDYREMKRKKKAGGEGEDGETTATTNGGETSEATSATEPAKTVAETILAIEPKYKIDFTMPKGGLKDAGGKRNRSKRVARFPMNPEANWGPKPRALGYEKGSCHVERDDGDGSVTIEKEDGKKRKVDVMMDGNDEGGKRKTKAVKEDDER